MREREKPIGSKKNEAASFGSSLIEFIQKALIY